MTQKKTILFSSVVIVVFLMLSYFGSQVLSFSPQDKSPATVEAQETPEAAAAPTSVARFINLNPYGAFIRGGATLATGFGPFSGIRLPASGTPDFSFGFTVPPDYVPGTSLIVRLVWHSPSTSCGISLQPNFISVARPGRTHIIGPGASSGLDPVGGSTLIAPATANQSSAKDYLITRPDGVTDLRPGDSVIFGLFRSAGAGADTCAGDLVIQGVSILY
jgi:hypothetical protein